VKLWKDNFGITFHHWALTWGMVFGTVFWLVLWSVNNQYARFFVEEGGLIERAQFVFLFFSGIYFVLTVRKEKSSWRWFFLLATICSFFSAGEEVSWGQRIFNIDTPAILEDVNVQGEINIHNLEFFQRYRHWYLGGVGLLGLVATYIRFTFFQRIKPDNNLRFLFFLILLTCLLMEYTNSQFGRIPIDQAREARYFAGRLSEIGELAFSMAALSYAWSKYFFCHDRQISYYRRQAEKK
jgi:hypothetical protein